MFYVNFTNPFKHELKLALLDIYFSRELKYFSIKILNFTVSISWNKYEE